MTSNNAPAPAVCVTTVVVIPAFQPGEALVEVARALSRAGLPVVIVDDGSGLEYRRIFDEAADIQGVRILRHETNRGKGAALKTGIAFALSAFPSLAGVITADADGQHRPEDIVRVNDRFRGEPDSLVLGARSFQGEVPLRSSFGNRATRWAMRLLVGGTFSDTQTGLRAIPRGFAETLLDLRSARYEFELDMLIAARQKAIQVIEEPIQTIYEDGNACSHFNPLLDSMRIYFVLLRFCSTSLLAAVVDNLVFYLAYRAGANLWESQVAGRAMSVLFNYLAVRTAVFYAREAHSIALPKYLALVAASGALAYAGIQQLTEGYGFPVLWAKIGVESVLFFVNFAVQRHWVFPKRDGERSAVGWTLMSRMLLWAAMIGGIGAVLYGIYAHRLLEAATWTPSGAQRFRVYTLAFAVGSGLFFVMARRFFGAALVLATLICSMLAAGAMTVPALLLLALSSMVLGRALFKDSDWFLSFLAGLAVWAFAMAVLATAPIHYGAVYAAAMTAVILWRRHDALDVLRDVGRAILPEYAPSPATYWAFCLLAFALVAQWFAAVKPEVSADGLAMHLAIAADLANHHAFSFDFREFVWALMPMGADYCYALAYGLGGEGAARLLNFVMLAGIAYLIFRVSQRWVSGAVACLLAAVFVCAPLAQMVTGSMLVENFVAALCLGAGAALWRFHREPSGRALLLCAFLMGSAVGWKVGAAAVAIAMAPLFVASAIRNRAALGPRRALMVAMAALLFLGPAMFPYVKAYALSGNPIYPFPNEYFASAYIQEDLRDGRYREPLSVRTPMDLTFETSRFYEGQDGSFGYQYLLLLPLCFVAFFLTSSFTGSYAGRSAILIGIVSAVIIGKTQPNARYFYFALPFLMVGSAAAIAHAQKLDRWLLRACSAGLLGAAALNLWFLPTSNWHHRDFFLRPLFSQRGRDEYVRYSAPVREVIDFVNRKGGRVVLTQGSEVAGIHAPVHANHWHNLRFRKQVEACRRPEDVLRLVSDLRVTYLIATEPPDASELTAVPALHEFLKVCTAPEFRAGRSTARTIAPDCGERIRASSQSLHSASAGSPR